MTALAIHVLFFLGLAAAIVVMGTFYGEAEDGPAFRAMPRRYGVFCLSCLLVAGVMLVCEHLFASV
jgi:hypothetical protein